MKYLCQMINNIIKIKIKKEIGINIINYFNIYLK